MCRDFYLHKRSNGLYYVEFVDKVTGKKLSAKSTGETEKIKAQVKAETWLLNGIPTDRMKKTRSVAEAAGIASVLSLIKKTELDADDALKVVSLLKSMGLIDISAVSTKGQGAIPFVDYLQKFWDYDKSEYIQAKIGAGHRFTRSYVHECQNRIKSILIPFFGDKKLNCVVTDDLSRLSSELAARGLSASSISQILWICRSPLKWAHSKKIISDDPGIGLIKYAIKNKKRGVLTIKETRALMYEYRSNIWTDKRAYVASLVAMTTGARMGECLALRRSDIMIKSDMINIEHSYSRRDGLKCPKNGETRLVFLLPRVRAALLDLLADNPHIDKKKNDPDYDPFIFYSLQPSIPCDNKFLLEGFKAAMDNLNNEYREASKKTNREQPEIYIDHKKRNIIFHSWRHFFCSKLTEKIPGEKVAKVSGHLSEAIFKKYADHIEEDNVREVANAAAEIFETIIPFRKAG